MNEKLKIVSISVVAAGLIWRARVMKDYDNSFAGESGGCGGDWGPMYEFGLKCQPSPNLLGESGIGTCAKE